MLQLVPIAERHLADVQAYASDPSIGAMSTVPSPYPADGAIRWYDQVADRVAQGRAVVFAMTEEGAFGGVISINGIDGGTARAHVDYWVAVPHQGRGIASQAVALAMDYAGTALNLKALLSNCLTANVASARVLERNGFVERDRSVISQGRFKGQELRRFYRRLAVPAPQTRA